jgi:AcrR family transcriptional regulator
MAAALPKAEQSDRTRTALLSVAHRLFAEQGYADTSTQDIVDGAKVTRGALYYHFRSKKGIFQAVFEQLRYTRTQTAQERIQAAEGDLWYRLVETGCAAFIEASSDRGGQRIMFLDGPSVLDSRIWHENVPAVNLIRQGLEQLAAAGFIEEAPYKTLAHLLWGSFLEASLYITYATDILEAQREMAQGLAHLFGSLRIKPQS